MEIGNEGVSLAAACFGKYYSSMVQTSKGAFEAIERRLIGDVGFLIDSAKKNDQHPNWALVRTLFPIAESLARLTFPNESNSSVLLPRFLSEILGRQNPKYRVLSHIICQIWRHGLTHTDEPPCLLYGQKSIAWSLSISDWEHLRISYQNEIILTPGTTNTLPPLLTFHFVIEAFYADLKQSCEYLKSTYPNSPARTQIYNSWYQKRIIIHRKRNKTNLKKTKQKSTTKGEREAVQQMKNIINNPSLFSPEVITVSAEVSFIEQNSAST